MLGNVQCSMMIRSIGHGTSKNCDQGKTTQNQRGVDSITLPAGPIIKSRMNVYSINSAKSTNSNTGSLYSFQLLHISITK